MARNFNLLGTFEILEDGVPSPVMKRNKACALLTSLIVAGQMQTREAVADLLWEANSTAQSLKSLRMLIMRIRKETPELIVQRSALGFQPTAETTVDYLILIEALARDDVAQLDQALRLYRGDLLAGFYLDDCFRFNEWLLVEREQLWQRVMSAHHRLCETYAEQNQWAKGIDLAQRWIALDDLGEEAYRWLMRFYTANGQKSAALQTFERCRQRLDTELGVEPAAATVQLAEQIAQQPDEIDDIGQWLPTTQPAALEFPDPLQLAEPGALPPHSYVPYHRNAVFTGREHDLLQLAAQLLPWPEHDGLIQTTAITGMGGLGKTQVAVEYAYRYGRYYPGGVYWLNFEAEENVSEDVAAIGGERGLALFTDDDRLTLSQKVDRVRRAWQEATPRLLIFDNCEDPNVAADWLPVTGGCRVLITSRRQRWPKALPITVTPLEILPREDSVFLLQELAEHLSPAAAASVADEVGDWPLALHLAGSFLGRYESVAVETYLTQLRDDRLLDHASLQGAHARYSPTGHELNVARTFALSLDQLDQAEAADLLASRLLVRAAWLAPNEPIALDFLRQTMAFDSDQNTELFQAAMTRLLSLGFFADADQDFVIMHRLVGYFALTVLSAEGSLVEDARVAVEEGLIERLTAQRSKPNGLMTLPYLATHLRTVTDSGLEDKRHLAARLTNFMGEHLLLIAEFTEAELFLNHAQTLTEVKYGLHSLEMADVQTNIGHLLVDRGQFAAAFPYYERANAIYEDQLGLDHVLTARSLNKLGGLRLRLGPYESARPYLEQAIEIRERLLGPDHPETLGSINNLGVMYNFMGDHAGARPYFQKVLDARERTLGPNHLLTATTLNNLGDLLGRSGEVEIGRPYLERALKIRQSQLGPGHHLTVSCQINLGELLRRSHEYELAQQHLEEALAATQEKLGEGHYLTARALNSLGILWTEMGRFDEAQATLEKALATRQAVRGPEHQDVAYSLICLGELYQARGDKAAARANYEQALAILEPQVVPTHSGLKQARENLRQLGE